MCWVARLCQLRGIESSALAQELRRVAVSVWSHYQVTLPEVAFGV